MVGSSFPKVRASIVVPFPIYPYIPSLGSFKMLVAFVERKELTERRQSLRSNADPCACIAVMTEDILKANRLAGSPTRGKLVAKLGIPKH